VNSNSEHRLTYHAPDGYYYEVHFEGGMWHWQVWDFSVVTKGTLAHSKAGTVGKALDWVVKQSKGAK
jgi:hypothetical protein